jgi:hypothetical protein
MQSYHADFSKFDFVRFAGIISFEDLTTLEVQISPRNKQTIKLEAGEAIIFRGDLFHAGSAYTKENRRIYFKAIPKVVFWDMRKRMRWHSDMYVMLRKVDAVRDSIFGNNYIIIVKIAGFGRITLRKERNHHK